MVIIIISIIRMCYDGEGEVKSELEAALFLFPVETTVKRSKKNVQEVENLTAAAFELS